MKRRFLIYVLLVTTVLGITVYWGYHTYRNAFLDFHVVKTTQFLGLAIGSWETDFLNHKNNLPRAFPNSFEEISQYGYLETTFLESISQGIDLHFFTPPTHIPDGFIIVKAIGPSRTFVVRLTKVQNAEEWPLGLAPIHQPLVSE